MDHTATYDRAAPSWDRALASLGYHTAYRGFLDGRAVPDGPVLDIGAGTGAFSGAWLSAGGSAALTLLDPSPQMLARAAACCSRLGVLPEQVCSALEHFKSPHRFRTILAAHVIELCPCPETAMARIADLLNPGGQLFLIVSRPHWCNWLIWLRYRHRWFAAGAVRAMAESAGLALRGTHAFHAGPPARTSLGYHFLKP